MCVYGVGINGELSSLWDLFFILIGTSLKFTENPP